MISLQRRDLPPTVPSTATRHVLALRRRARDLSPQAAALSALRRIHARTLTK